MAAIRTFTALSSAVAVAASGTSNSAALDLRTGYTVKVTAQVTNSATAPTTPSVVTLQVSGDNTTWYLTSSRQRG